MGRARRHGTELLAGIRLAMQLIRNAQPVHSDAPVIKIKKNSDAPCSRQPCPRKIVKLHKTYMQQTD
jgi:hypothetical protein